MYSRTLLADLKKRPNESESSEIINREFTLPLLAPVTKYIPSNDARGAGITELVVVIGQLAGSKYLSYEFRMIDKRVAIALDLPHALVAAALSIIDWVLLMPADQST